MPQGQFNGLIKAEFNTLLSGQIPGMFPGSASGQGESLVPKRGYNASFAFDGLTNVIISSSKLISVYQNTITGAGKSFSLRCIIKTGTFGAQRNIFYASGINTTVGGIQLNIVAGTGKLNLIVYKNLSNYLNNNSTGVSLGPNSWYDILITYDSTQTNTLKPQLYVRNILAGGAWINASGTFTQTGTADFIQDTLGQTYLWGYNANWFQGNIMEAGTLWNRVLTSDEMTVLIGAGPDYITRSNMVAADALKIFSPVDMDKLINMGAAGLYLQDQINDGGTWNSNYPSYGQSGFTYSTPFI